MSTGNDLKQSMSDSLRQSAASHANLAQFDKAIDYYLQSLAMTRQLQDRPSELEILREVGNVYIKANQPDKAVDCLESGLSLAHQSIASDPLHEAHFLQLLAEAHDAAQNLSSAAVCLSKAGKILEASAAMLATRCRCSSAWRWKDSTVLA
jgi:tetratricopeptide (TPR) repeat protein